MQVRADQMVPQHRHFTQRIGRFWNDRADASVACVRDIHGDDSAARRVPVGTKVQFVADTSYEGILRVKIVYQHTDRTVSRSQIFD